MDCRYDARMKDEGRILVLNSGSSSIKFALYTAVRDPARVLAGTISGIGATPEMVPASTRAGSRTAV